MVGTDSPRLITAHRRRRHSLACRGTGFGHFLRCNRLQNYKDKTSACDTPESISAATRCGGSHPHHQGRYPVLGFPPLHQGWYLELPSPSIRAGTPYFPPPPSGAGTLCWGSHLTAYPGCSGAAEGTSYLLIGGHCQGARAAHTGRCRVTGITADKARPAALTLVPFCVVLAALGHSPWSVLRAANTSPPHGNSRDC